MRTAILLHGTGGSNRDYFWFADTKAFLEQHGYDVWWPLLPETDRPRLSATLGFLRASMPRIGEDTIVIGHSSACPLILCWLQGLDVRIRQAVLVAGFYRALDDDGASAAMLPDRFDWKRIGQAAREIILINSDNDPWGCTDDKAREAAIKLGAKLIINSGQGHMGSITYDQPYREFALLKRLLAV